MGCYRHSREAERVVQYDNTTTVPACLCGNSSEDPVEPCPREIYGLCNGNNPNCLPEATKQCGTEDEVDDSRQACGPYALADIPDNTFAVTDPETRQTSPCRKVGFKALQVRKCWHGNFGFMHEDGAGVGFLGTPPNFSDVCSGGCAGYEPERGAPDQTKYIEIDVVLSQGDQTYRRHAMLNSLSGSTGLLNCADPDDPSAALAYAISTGRLPLGLDDVDGSNFDPHWFAERADFPGIAVGVYASAFALFSGSPVTTTGTGTSQIEFDITSTDVDRPGEVSAALSGGTWTLTWSGAASGASITLTVTNTEVHWVYNPPTGTGDAIHIDITYGATYTAAACYQDWLDLASTGIGSGIGPLNDDGLYPWRMDSYVTVAPMFSYAEYPAAQRIDWNHPCDWEGDGYAEEHGYDGSVRGAFLEAGRLGYWDFRHETWAICDACDEAGTRWEEFAYGAKSGFNKVNDPSDAAMPGTATQWTENYWATLLWPGAFLSYGQVGSGVLWGQIWAEIQVNRPGMDFNRPCGSDRWLLDETTVRCVTEWDSGTDTITVDSATDLATGKAGIFGVTGVSDGHYDITRTDSTHFVVSLGSRTDAEYPNDIGTGIIGQVRFPSADETCAGGDCSGRRGRGDYLLAEFNFNFRDFAERDRVITQYGACPDCDLDAPGDPIRPYQAGHGLPRAVTSVDVSEHNVPFSKCDPQVMAISPNGDSWPNGTTHPFPDFDEDDNIITPAGATFYLDERYGSRWQSIIIQTLADPFWQPPHKPCIDCGGFGGVGIGPTGCDWIEDLPTETHPGMCPEDDECGCLFDPPGAKYYAQRPWVEARTTVPDGCPDPPEFVILEYLEQSEIDVVTITETGKILPPPSPVGFTSPGCPFFDLVVAPNVVITPWMLWLGEASCVCEKNGSTGARFQSEYRADGINVTCAP